MTPRRLFWLGAAFLLLPAFLLRPYGGGGGPASGGAGTPVTLSRTINNPGGAPTGSTAFVTMGYPFKDGDVPNGDIVSCTLGGASVPCSLIQRKVNATDSSIEWGDLLVDFSQAPVAANGSASLVVSAAPGSWPGASGYTNGVWTALADQVKLTSLVSAAKTNAATTSADTLSFASHSLAWLVAGLSVVDLTNPSDIPGGTTITTAPGSGGTVTISQTVTVPSGDLIAFGPAGGNTVADVYGSGTWVANFNGDPTNGTPEIYGNTPQGLFVEVTAAFVDNTPFAVSSSSYAGTTATLGTASDPGLAIGDRILLTATTPGICTVLTDSGSGLTCSIATNPGTVTAETPEHRNLQAVMDYWTPKGGAGGSACTGSGGSTTCPTESWGPFIENARLHPGSAVAALSTLTAFAYNADFTRNGSEVRGCAAAAGYCNIFTAAESVGVMTNLDGSSDWTADNPGTWISQDYTEVGETEKLPTFQAGLGGSYNPCASGTQYGYPCVNSPITAYTSSTLTFSNPTGGADVIFGYNPTGVGQVNAVAFTGTAAPGGLALNTLYWIVDEGGFTFSVYDNELDALANGTTGRQTLTSIGTSAAVYVVVAPGGTGEMSMILNYGGPRPDLSLTSEWGGPTYYVGNTQAWQATARITAYSNASNPVYGVDVEDGSPNLHLLSIMDAPNTPSCGGGCVWTSYDTTGYAAIGSTYSSNINSGVNPAGGTGQWNWTGSSAAHVPNPMYGVWLAEGTPFLRDMLELQTNGLLGLEGNTLNRNFSVNGTPYYGTTTCSYGGGNLRIGAWHTRDLAEALFAATQGTPEEAYFQNILVENMNACAALQAFMPASFDALGEAYTPYTLPVTGSSTLANPNAEPLMLNYAAATTPWAAILVQDRVPSLVTQADFVGQYMPHLYGYGGYECPYFGSAYQRGQSLSDYGVTEPGTWISSWSDDGIGLSTAAFSTSTPVITLATSPENGTSFYYAFQNGDYVRFQTGGTGDNVQIGSGMTPGPSITGITTAQGVTLQDNTDYVVLDANPAAGTFEIATQGNPTQALQVQSLPSPNAVFNVMVPVVSGNSTNCPATGTVQSSNFANSDIYLNDQRSALALMIELGIASAGTSSSGAYYQAYTRYTGNCDTAGSVHWCLVPPP